MNIIYFTIASLATWRLSRILTKEVGPYHVIENFRNLIINEKWSPIHCLKCTTVWVGFVFATFIPQYNIPFLFYWLGLSGSAVFIDTIYEFFEPVVTYKNNKSKK
jgi:hypothetical protein